MHFNKSQSNIFNQNYNWIKLLFEKLFGENNKRTKRETFATNQIIFGKRMNCFSISS